MRIRIFGCVASGKSTLAKKIGKELNLPVFSTDDFVYEKNYSNKRDLKKRNDLAQKAIVKKDWVIEGVHHAKWIEGASKKVDFIIILKVPLSKLIFRLIKRSFSEKNNRFNFKSTSKLIFELIRDYKSDFLAYNKIVQGKNYFISKDVTVFEFKKATNKKHIN